MSPGTHAFVRLLPSLGLCFAFAAGCSAAAPAPRTEPTVAATAAPTDEAPPPDTDAMAEPPAPTFEALRTAAMACPTLEDGSFDTCEALDTWGSSDQPAFADGKANDPLLQMLADKDPKARILAAIQLRMTLHEENLDGKTTDRVLAALAAEQAPAAIEPMAAMVTSQNLVKVGKLARLIEIAKAHPSADAKVEIMLHVSFFNRDKALLDWAVASAKDSSHQLRNAALAIAYDHTKIDAKRACKLIDDFRRDKDGFVKHRAHANLARRPECKDHFAAMVGDLERAPLEDISKGGVHFEDGEALVSLCKITDLDTKLRPRVAKAGARIASSAKVSDNVRVYGLEATVACDPAAGKALAEKLSADPNARVSSRAKELAK